jgi:hypothetical protein
VRAARLVIRQYEREQKAARERRRECRGCGKGVPQGSRGRPPEWCERCRGGPKWRAVRRAVALKSYHRMRAAHDAAGKGA